MQTTDELTNFKLMFNHDPTASVNTDSATDAVAKVDSGESSEALRNHEPIESEEQALRQLKAVPIYFASSYALVKPYVIGFNSNVLDAPSLKTVRIDTSWSEPKGR